jgi:pimeloyl-ACP methyl ester carboxylesterase
MTTLHPESAAAEAITIAPVGLDGFLTLPTPGHGVVLFAHGSGSGRNSPRNRFVARELHKAGLGTLLFDLLTATEARDRYNVFDIDLLARRLVLATDWLNERDDTRDLPVGYFGASTGAAAALVASTLSATPINAIVSRGGRPDLAHAVLARVTAPVLLIVGGEDREVLTLNRRAFDRLPGEKEIAVIKGAGHLFEEAGALEAVVDLARRWFKARLGTPRSS